MSWLDELSDDTLGLIAADSGEGSEAGDTLAPLACQTCPPSPLTLVTVEFTDLPDERAVFAGERPQYVNLRSDRHVAPDTPLASANQLRRTPPFLIKVTPPQAATVRVRLVREESTHNFPAGSARRSARERGLAHLQYAQSMRPMQTEADGELLVQPGLPVAAQAGFRYRVEAALAGSEPVRSTNAVEVRRRIYIRPVVLYRRGWPSARRAIIRVANRMRRLGIDIEVLPVHYGTARGVTLEADFSAYSTIGVQAQSRPESVSKHRPHVVSVVVGEFTLPRAQMSEVSFERVLTRQANGSFDALPWLDLRRDGQSYRLLPLPNQGALVGQAYAKLSGRPTAHLPASDVIGLEYFDNSVMLDLQSVALAGYTGNSITVGVKLKVFTYWFVGWAFGSTPVIYLNMRDGHRTDFPLDSHDAAALLVHELGHMLWMTSDGRDSLPDAQAHHYGDFNNNGRNHVGHHCSTGVAAGTALWSDAAQAAASCTMWGSLKQIEAFCAECRTTLRKVDLSAGF